MNCVIKIINNDEFKLRDETHKISYYKNLIKDKATDDNRKELKSQLNKIENIITTVKNFFCDNNCGLCKETKELCDLLNDAINKINSLTQTKKIVVKKS
jgi:hypothetical protein